MKKQRRFIQGVRIMILSCALAGFTEPGLADATKQVMLAATEYPPYYGELLPDQGVITEIIRAAFKQAGYDVKVKFLPWKRALEMTRKGEFDALFTGWYRKAREQWFAFSDPLPISNEIGFYKRKDRNISYKTIEDLRPYKIGVVRGYSNPLEFEQAKLATEEVTEDRLNIQKLAVGRIDLVLIDKIIGRHIMDTELPESAQKLEWLDPPLRKDDQYLLFSKIVDDYREKIADFNRGLRQIIEAGIVKAIVAKHDFR
jgi:polar amino acid transport system substrate-binding protein